MSQSPPSSATPSPGSHSATHHLSATIINPIPGRVRKPRVGKVGELWRGVSDPVLSDLCSSPRFHVPHTEVQGPRERDGNSQNR